MLRLIWLLVALWALPGCSEGRDVSAGDGVVELVYWPPPNRFDLAMTRPLVERWNRDNPRVHVTMQPLPAGRSSEEVLMAAMVGRTTPDICSNILTGTVERMVRAKALVPLSSRFADFASHVRARSPEGTLDAFRSSDGKVYQLPWKANPMALTYNTKLLAQAGIAPPRTHGQLLAAAVKLTEDSDGDGRTDRWAMGMEMNNTWWKRFDDLYPLYIAASGGRTLIRGAEVLFDDDDAMVRALTLLRTLFARGYAPKTYFAGDLFIQGKLAIFRGSASTIPDIRSKAPQGFSFDFMPWPVPDDYPAGKPAYTFGDIKSMVVFASCKHPKDAWRFLKYLTSTRADLALITDGSQLPMRRDLLTAQPFADALRARPLLAKLAAMVPYTRGTDDTPHLVEIFDTLSAAYEAGAVLGLRTPKEAVARASRRVQHILKMWE